MLDAGGSDRHHTRKRDRSHGTPIHVSTSCHVIRRSLITHVCDTCCYIIVLVALHPCSHITSLVRFPSCRDLGCARLRTPHLGVDWYACACTACASNMCFSCVLDVDACWLCVRHVMLRCVCVHVMYQVFWCTKRSNVCKNPRMWMVNSCSSSPHSDCVSICSWDGSCISRDMDIVYVTHARGVVLPWNVSCDVVMSLLCACMLTSLLSLHVSSMVSVVVMLTHMVAMSCWRTRRRMIMIMDMRMERSMTLDMEDMGDMVGVGVEHIQKHRISMCEQHSYMSWEVNAQQLRCL